MKKGNETKERLLQMATELMLQKGFGATSVNDLLDAAGIKKGTLYYHFPGKEDLGLAVLERVRAMFFKSLDETLSNPDPYRGMCDFFDSVLERQRRKGFIGGCLFGNTALEMSDKPSGYSELTKKVFHDWISRIEEAIRAGQSAGRIRNDIPSADMAQVIVATIEGGIMLSRLKKAEEPLRNCLLSLKGYIYKEARNKASKYKR